MKIALFAETYLPYINGVVTHITILKNGLEKLGHEVLIVTADPNAKRHYIEDGVLHCPAHSFKRLYGYGLANPISRRRLKIIKEFNPDILHMHQEFGVGLFAAKAAARLGKPFVYTLHTMYDEYVFYIAPKIFVPAIKRISHRYVHYLAGKADALTSPSAKAEDFFKNCKVKKQVQLIPNTVQMEEFAPENFTKEELNEVRESLGIKPDETAAIFVGRMGKEKSVDVLLDYWARFFSSPEDKIHLVCVGDGPVLESLKERAKTLGISDKVTFTGSVAHENVPIIFAACNIFVTASLTEMMSVSMLEGLAAGLPVVQKYDPLNAGQFKEGVNGYTFKTEEEFEKIIRDLASLTPEEKAAKKKEVRDCNSQNGEIRLAKRMLKVYSEVSGIPVEDLDDDTDEITEVDTLS
ncbi:MAG TPA: glycosyltransferase family 4 protein [Ruminococcaceae bacterium]|nr:glycosyltransferase family 4 protein [Oscillospiraceae bacterium]